MNERIKIEFTAKSSKKGVYWDSAVVERFFGDLRKEGRLGNIVRASEKLVCLVINTA